MHCSVLLSNKYGGAGFDFGPWYHKNRRKPQSSSNVFLVWKKKGLSAVFIVSKKVPLAQCKSKFQKSSKKFMNIENTVSHMTQDKGV